MSAAPEPWRIEIVGAGWKLTPLRRAKTDPPWVVAELPGVAGSLVVSDDGEGRGRVVGVEQWAQLRREHFVAGKSIKRLARETGLSRNTVRAALRSDSPPVYARASKPSVLEPFKDEICRLLAEDPKLSGVRVRELLEPLGCETSKTVVDDYLREVRPLFQPPHRTFSRAVYRPGEVCQFDVWQPRAEIPVGHGQTRQGWVVVACLGYSRAGAGVLIFSKETEDLLTEPSWDPWRLLALENQGRSQCPESKQRGSRRRGGIRLRRRPRR